MQDFRIAFLRQYPENELNAFAALGYDAAGLLLKAIADAGSNKPEAVLQALSNIQDFQGVTGTISFGEGRRIPDKSVSVMKIDAGKLSLSAQVLPAQVPDP